MKRLFRKQCSLLLVMAMMCVCLTAWGEADTDVSSAVIFAGGSGTMEDPWQIATAEQLLAINSALDGNYILTSDIDLSEYTNWPMIGMYIMDENSEEGEDPVAAYAFSGVFDGNGHTISNLSLDASEDFTHMFGVGLFACVGEGGVVKNLTVQDYHVSGMMLVGGVVGYAFHCKIDNVHVTVSDPEHLRNTASSSMVMVGGIIGGLTLSECTNNSVAYTDILAAPGGNSGALGGGFSKPKLENCTVESCTVTAVLGEVPMFGMTEGAWIGGLTGCVNLDDYDTTQWYVKNCLVKDTVVTVHGAGAYVGGLIGSAGSALENENAPRTQIQGCTLQQVEINIFDDISCVGGLIGGSFSEGDPFHAFLVDDCTLTDVKMIVDATDFEERAIGKLIGRSVNNQLMDTEGNVVDIKERDVEIASWNSQVDVRVQNADGLEMQEVTLVGQVLAP